MPFVKSESLSLLPRTQAPLLVASCYCRMNPFLGCGITYMATRWDTDIGIYTHTRN